MSVIDPDRTGTRKRNASLDSNGISEQVWWKKTSTSPIQAGVIRPIVQLFRLNRENCGGTNLLPIPLVRFTLGIPISANIPVVEVRIPV